MEINKGNRGSVLRDKKIMKEKENIIRKEKEEERRRRSSGQGEKSVN